MDIPKNDKNEKQPLKLIILHGGNQELSDESLDSLLAKVECDLDEVQVSPVGNIDDALKREFGPGCVLVVVLDDEILANTTLEAIVMMATSQGCRLIGVWASGETGAAIHPAVAKYGTAQIPWDAHKFAAALEAECPAPFENSDGTQSARHRVKYNKCGG